jgi:5-methylcytosine-specific restriction endonuclease McrA
MDTYKKKAVPKAIREQLWIQKVGRKFETKCKTTWCRNKINVFDFQAGHDVPECKGGTTDITNLQPICSRCNSSMGSQYTFKEWCNKGKQDSKWIKLLKSIGALWTYSDTKESGTKSRQRLTSPNAKQPK